ncbi:zinc ribbon domain-containing protein [Haloplanus sp. GCM10025708]|uniref:DUF7575 domain-containing protein n=1 Tax=Haloferacaceae TaxID=1644056 RepID=UPI0036149B15
MSRSVSQKRPWLAAVLGTLATGLGHLYLRRWRRGLGWLTVLFGVSYFFVDPSALDALASGTVVDPLAIAPIVVVGSLSVADAYLLARAQNAVARTTVATDGRLTHCPGCGNELDSDLDFCHWCTAELPDFEVSGPEDADANER